MFYDPEIATSPLFDGNNEFLFSAGNLNVLTIDSFVKAHACNRFCPLLGLRKLKEESENA